MGRYYKDENMYNDILYLPHHRSKERIPMSLHDRAAQFSAFKALSGHEEAVIETARLTDEIIELDETVIGRINETLYDISQHLSEKWSVSITYFKPDELKLGGSYLTDLGIVKKIDSIEQIVIMDNGIKIPMEQIISIEII